MTLMTGDPWGESGPKKQVFFISPIGEEGSETRRNADQVLRHLVRKALASSTYQVERADEDKHPGAITPRILSKIIEADLVLADLSGFNPNVFYELAVAHGHHKPVVHMQKSDERPAFDVKDMRIVRYQLSDPDKLESAVTDLRGQADLAIGSPNVIETPLTATGKFLAIDQSADPQAEIVKRLLEIEKAVSARSLVRPSDLRGVDDTFAVARWIENQLGKGAFGRDEIEQLKNQDTSSWFDQWVDSLVSRFASSPDPWDQFGGATKGSEPDPWASSSGSQDEAPF